MNKSEVTLFLVLREEIIESRQRSYFKQFVRPFSQLFIFAEEGTDDSWVQEQATYRGRYKSKEGKVAALNQAADKVRTSHILLLESDECCTLSDLPVAIQQDTCYRALVDVKADEQKKQNYQVRLFPASHDLGQLFAGIALPDLASSFYGSKWSMGEDIIPVQKSNLLFNIADAETEAARSSGVMGVFWHAILDSNNYQYQQAEKGFRQLIKGNGLLEFDYLAVLNGLTNALVEQHKLKSAEEVARKSLSVNDQQYAPYISLYKVNKLRGKAEKAFQYLDQYLDVLDFPSRANLDVYLSKADCHFLMAEISFKQGRYQRAFDHYEQFYELNGGSVSQEILEKLFIYAIELKNYEKSVQYFEDIFGSHIPDNLNDDMSARLLESLSLFMDNGWYDFVSQIYQDLVTHNPEDNKLLNGWITTLIKNKEIDKAQELLASRKAS